MLFIIAVGYAYINRDTSLSRQTQQEVTQMVDNRAAGFYGISGALNFKSGDISGTAAKTNEEKAGTDAEYMRLEKENGGQKEAAKYSDKSAQLNATLSSLAMLNISSIISSKLPKLKQSTKRFTELINETEEKLITLNEEHEKNKEKKNPFKKENPFSKQDSEEEEEEEYY